MMGKIELPWFPKELSPNSRVNWRVKHKHFQKQKNDACFICVSEKIPHTAGAYHLRITFCPPDGRRRDLDNCLASIKGAIDGIAMACKMDDRDFQPLTIEFGEKCKGGKVVVAFNLE